MRLTVSATEERCRSEGDEVLLFGEKIGNAVFIKDEIKNAGKARCIAGDHNDVAIAVPLPNEGKDAERDAFRLLVYRFRGQKADALACAFGEGGEALFFEIEPPEMLREKRKRLGFCTVITRKQNGLRFIILHDVRDALDGVRDRGEMQVGGMRFGAGEGYGKCVRRAGDLLDDGKLLCGIGGEGIDVYVRACEKVVPRKKLGEAREVVGTILEGFADKTVIGGIDESEIARLGTKRIVLPERFDGTLKHCGGDAGCLQLCYGGQKPLRKRGIVRRAFVEGLKERGELSYGLPHQKSLCAFIDVVIAQPAVFAEYAVCETGEIQHLCRELCRGGERKEGLPFCGYGLLLGNDQKGADAVFGVALHIFKNRVRFAAAGGAVKQSDHRVSSEYLK